MLNYKNLSRRKLLASLGGVAATQALLPFIPRVEAAEADGVIKRYSYWFEFTMPIDKSLVDENYQGNQGKLAFKKNYAPLNDKSIVDQILFLRNVSRPQSDGGDGPHPSGVAGISGWKGAGGGKYNKQATSLDQLLAQHFSGKTAISDIRAGFNNNGKDGDFDRSTSVVKGTIKPRYQTPVSLYNDIFSNFSPSNSGANQQPSDLLRQRQSVLDYMNESVQKLRNKVSSIDKQKIDEHLTAIRETEIKLTSLANAGGTVGSCDIPNAPNIANNAKEDKVYPVYSQLMASALACDLTRVAGAHYGTSACRNNYGFLNSYKGGGNFHNGTHGKHSSDQYLRDVLKFRAAKVAEYLKMLENIKEPDGSSLLDNTIFFWTTDVSRGHENKKDMHCILAGGKDRLKKQGEMVNVNAKHNDVMTSIAQFCGLDIDKFGDPKHCNGLLPNSVFS